MLLFIQVKKGETAQYSFGSDAEFSQADALGLFFFFFPIAFRFLAAAAESRRLRRALIAPAKAAMRRKVPRSISYNSYTSAA